VAHVLPISLPDWVRGDPKRRAEVVVFEALRDGLDDQYSVFYSFSWIVHRSTRGATEGEADFVVAHPDRGVLLVEVKGGFISYDGARGSWLSRDRDGMTYEIDPIKQLRASKAALIDKVKSVRAWDGRWLDVGYCVAFPHVDRIACGSTADLPPEVIITRDDFASIQSRLAEIYEYWSGTATRRRLGLDGIEILRGIIAPTFSLPAHTSLDGELKAADRQILQLTRGQFQTLEALRWMPRVAVWGGAGTGKTYLAMEKARRMAAEGRRTALICFNKPLAEFLRTSMAGEEDVVVGRFHEICYKLARKAGLDVPDPDLPNLPQRFYDQDLPEMVLEALDRMPGERFDGLVVDEAQDFLGTWWVILEFLLRKPKQDPLYAFCDDNQSIYRNAGARIPSDLQRYALDENLRNTKPVFELASKYYAGGMCVSKGPAGIPVETVEAETSRDVRQALSRVLHRLISEEGIARKDVQILTGKRPDRSVLGGVEKVGAFPISHRDCPRDDGVAVETIHRFKGLESPVVVLLDLDEALKRRELLYVGLTRARLHLVIIDSRQTLLRVMNGQ